MKTVFQYRGHVFKKDLKFTILINAKTMLKSKSRPRLSDNPGTGGGRQRSASKRKATPAAESSSNVQSSVAAKTHSLNQDPTKSALSDQPQMLVPQILSPQTPPPAGTRT